MDAGGTVVPPSDRQVLNNRANQLWHADSSFKAVPAKASMLSARIIPSKGGDTQYISMRAVSRQLPARLTRAANGKVVLHDYAYSRSKVDPRSEEHTSELQSLMRTSPPVSCRKKQPLTQLLLDTQIIKHTPL